MDVVLTEEGRRQASRGKLEVQYASFTDSTIFYSVDLLSGSRDVSNSLALECFSSPYDQITLEMNDAGNLHASRTSRSARAHDGAILSSSGDFVTGTAFRAGAEEVLSASLDSFRRNYLIGTIDPLFEFQEFGAGPSFLRFSLSDNAPIPKGGPQAGNTTVAPSFFQDPRFAGLPNFRFLPPVNRTRDTDPDFTREFIEQHKLADYPRIDSSHTYEDAVESVIEDVDAAKSTSRSMKVVFSPTTNTNNIHCQVFEVGSGRVKKLEVLDFGKVAWRDGSMKRVLFAGKVFLDSFGTHTFVRIFTLVLEK